MRQPFTLTAAGNVHAHDVALIGEGVGQRIEIAAVAGEPVHAEHEPVAVGITPFGIGDLVEPVGAEALKAAQAWLMCHGMVFQSLGDVNSITRLRSVGLPSQQQ